MRSCRRNGFSVQNSISAGTTRKPDLGFKTNNRPNNHMLQNLYPHIAGFHGLFRWIVLAIAVSAIYVAFSGWRGTKPPGANLFRLGLIFVLAMDLELISGLLLYFGASPNLRSAFIAHGVIMFLAVLCAHVGGALTRKAPTDVMKHRGPAIAWAISLLIMFAGIPRH